MTEVKSIGIDFDFPFSQFRRDKYAWRFKEIPEVESVFYRRSSNGKCHFKVYPKYPVRLFRSFMIRAYLQDDAFRIRGDLYRLFENGDNAFYDILFDSTCKGNGWRNAGQWKEMVL
jgi:hypothetical protein